MQSDDQTEQAFREWNHAVGDREDGLVFGPQGSRKSFGRAKKLAGPRKDVVFHILRHAHSLPEHKKRAAARLDAEVTANLATVGFDKASVPAVSASA